MSVCQVIILNKNFCSLAMYLPAASFCLSTMMFIIIIIIVIIVVLYLTSVKKQINDKTNYKNHNLQLDSKILIDLGHISLKF